MAGISYFNKETASDEIRSIYESMEKEFGGTMPTIYKVLIHSPEAMKAVRAFYTEAVPSWKLDKKFYALAYVKTSLLHNCHY
jgi:hypothetical protein